jgi:catalase
VRQVMNDTDRDPLVTNIVGHASDGVTEEMRHRVIACWANVDVEISARVAADLRKGDGATGNDAQAAAVLVSRRANRA